MADKDTNDGTQTVHVVVYEGCRDEKCRVNDDMAEWVRDPSLAGEWTRRDAKAVLVFETSVFTRVSEAVRNNEAVEIFATHVGMLQLLYEWLKQNCDNENQVTKAFEGEPGKGAPFIRLGPPSATADRAIMVIVEPYKHSELNEPFVSYGILYRVRDVTLIVAKELLPSSFGNTCEGIPKSGSAFYARLGELLDKAEKERGRVPGEDMSVLGKRFRGYESRWSDVVVEAPRPVRCPSIFDELKARRVESYKLKEQGEAKPTDVHDPNTPAYHTEQLAIEAMRGVVKGCGYGKVRLLRELHLDDLAGELVPTSCEDATSGRMGRACDGVDAKKVYEYVFCSALPKESSKDSVRLDEDFHPRIDLSFVDKETGRLLLAIEIDGEPHRQRVVGPQTEAAPRRDMLKDAYVRAIGGLALVGNAKKDYSSSSDLFSETSFTYIRLPTDGSTAYECESCGGDDDLRKGRVTIDELLRDRIEQEKPISECVIAPHRTIRDLQLENVDVPWDSLGVDKNSGRTSMAARYLKKLGLIQSDAVDKSRWIPTCMGRQLCGITLALFGEDQQAYCLYPDALEERIAQHWDKMIQKTNSACVQCKQDVKRSDGRE